MDGLLRLLCRGIAAPGLDGCHEEACEALGRIAGWAKNAIAMNEPVGKAKAGRRGARCTELRGHIERNGRALIDRGQRCRAGEPPDPAGVTSIYACRRPP